MYNKKWGILPVFSLFKPMIEKHKFEFNCNAIGCSDIFYELNLLLYKNDSNSCTQA